MLRIYVYLDDKFNQKTEVIERPYQPILDINLNLQLQDDSKEIRFDVYDASALTEAELEQIKQEDNKIQNINGSSIQNNSLQFDSNEEIKMNDQDWVKFQYIGSTKMQIDKILSQLVTISAINNYSENNE